MPDITDINDIIAAYHAGEIYCGPEVVALVAEIERLQRDAARLDWLADVENTIGNVQLPTACVERNVHSLRDAIDDAMGEHP